MPGTSSDKLEALLDSKERAAAPLILRTIPIGVIIARAPDDKIPHTNEFMGRLTGRPGRELEGLPISDIAHFPTFDASRRPAPADDRPLARALRGDRPGRKPIGAAR
jgi:hypothetical protein